ncbi:hypothetical protein QN277_001125 [Acacia crassicarpa]|uniref:Endonuclease/exonuclease/phosphatase domain-containing protein n=1 Tax=Acacia crassicarpa TaxID=499986 RepID=A0AAE1THZ5_9FABA|nr:hypothetical protein QN277_001125 [Acacia crassicarpa]
MIIAFWNCRGAGSQAFPLTTRDIVNKYGITILCLLEPHISGVRADKVSRRLGFSNWIRVESTGFSGGIWLLWNKDDFEITFLTSTTQLIYCQVKERDSNIVSLMTFVYGETSSVGRIALWNSLRSLATNSNLPWLVLGDFNIFLSLSDKLGGVDLSLISMRHFRNRINDTALIKAKIQGEKFTWEKQGLKERLDWVFTNFEWHNCFPHSIVRHKLKFKSDHRVVVVNSSLTSQRCSFKKTFSYQVAWTLEDDFKDLVNDTWHGKTWIQGLQSFQNSALQWNDNRLGNFTKKKKELIRRLEGIDRCRKMNLQTGLFQVGEKTLE